MNKTTYTLELDYKGEYSIVMREAGVVVGFDPFGYGPEAKAMAEYSLRYLAQLGEEVDSNV